MMPSKETILRIVLLGFAVGVFFSPLTISGSNTAPAAAAQESWSHPYNWLYQPIIDKYVKKGIIGLGVLIRTPEEGTWNGTGGYARIEDSTPIQVNTLFPSLSVVKTYTAAAIMLLREDGLIDLQAKIDTYLPSAICDRIANGHSVTVFDLLRHSSGIPDFDRHIPVLEPWNNPYDWTMQDNLEKVYDKPARFAPGAQWEYTNINYLLLVLIIDQITGSHVDFFVSRIFWPMGLTSTFYKSEPGLPKPPELVNYYYDRYGDGYIENVTNELCALYFNADFGYSGIIATLTDNARFLEGFVDGELVSSETFLEMAAPLPFPGQEWRGLGFSFWKYMDQEGIEHQVYATAGSGMEGYIELLYLPGPGVTICTATNTGTSNKPTTQEFMTELIEELLDAVFNKRIPPASANKRKLWNSVKNSDVKEIQIYKERGDDWVRPQHQGHVRIFFLQQKDFIASEIIKEGGIDGLQASLARIRKLRDNGSDIYFDQASINGIGYYLMNSGQIPEAIEVFKLNVEVFPKSFNVYDSLGEAYMKNGNNENAIKNYRKSLDLNPGNNNAREMLEKLEKK